jgi:hypothetical protein
MSSKFLRVATMRWSPCICEVAAALVASGPTGAVMCHGSAEWVGIAS